MKPAVKLSWLSGLKPLALSAAVFPVGMLKQTLTREIWCCDRVLEAKKKAEEHNDGAGQSSGASAPEEGILDRYGRPAGVCVLLYDAC